MARRCLECGEDLLFEEEIRRQRCAECVRFEYWNDEQQEKELAFAKEEEDPDTWK